MTSHKGLLVFPFHFLFTIFNANLLMIGWLVGWLVDNLSKRLKRSGCLRQCVSCGLWMSCSWVVKHEAARMLHRGFTAAAVWSQSWSISIHCSAATVSTAPDSWQAAMNCVGCGKPITDRYLLKAIDEFWHEDCLKCSCCECRLGEVGSSLFVKGDLLLCRRDYLRSACLISYSDDWRKYNLFA